MAKPDSPPRSLARPHTAARRSGALEHYPDPARKLRRLREAARDAAQAVHEYEREMGDVFGRYVIQPGDELDEDGLLAFVELAIADSPGQELEITLRTHRAREAGREAGPR